MTDTSLPTPPQITLGVDRMDRVHAEFLVLVSALQTCHEAEFAPRWAELVAHTEAHFAGESELMSASGFPARQEHEDEHQRVLGELRRFQSRIERGVTVIARAYVRETAPQWFDVHLRTMDSALAAHLRQALAG